MDFTVTQLTPHTGAEVRGLDLNEGVDVETRAALNRAFAEHHVLVVRGQQFTPPQFIAAAQVFGELGNVRVHGYESVPVTTECRHWRCPVPGVAGVGRPGPPAPE